MTSQTETSRPTLAAWVCLVGLAMAFGVINFDASVVNTALVTIRRDLGGGISASQWVLDGYTLFFAAGMLTAASVGDRIGHRRMCGAGFALFALASAGCALADSMSLLIGARVVQGIAAAMLLPSSLALIAALFPDMRERAKALGVWGGIAGIGFTVGPVLGGWLAQISWQLIFWVNVPLAAVFGVMVVLTAKPTVVRQHDFDLVGALLAAVGLVALTGGIIELGRVQEAAGDTVWAALLIVVGLAVLAAFLRVEHTRAEPMLPPHLIGSRPFRNAVITGAWFNFSMYGGLLAVSLAVPEQFGLTPLQTGLVIAPMMGVTIVGTVVSGFLASRFGPRGPMTSGFICGATGYAVMAISAAEHWLPGIVIGWALSGLVSLAMPAMTGVAMQTAPHEYVGVASGVLNTFRQTGGALGVAVAGLAIAVAGSPATGLAIVGALAVVSGLSAVVTTRRATANLRVSGTEPASGAEQADHAAQRR
ncbi:MFS transporter [Jongsikchunia kroppenstedtii]|uniref:MFS transporter n=1 Tax=Jongsikchunia kroppenstedtii TaxID=1121721 RepID=UPI0003A6B94F|nr:MFS transporter [Jongsikchunia kroppenstedtii]